MYLNNHSYFSLRYGTLSIENLVDLAVKNNIPALALTDICNSTGMTDFVKICGEKGIKPIGGMEFRNDNIYLYTGIARNNTGMKELNELVTAHNLSATPYPPVPPLLNNAFFILPFGRMNPDMLKENEYIGIKPQDVLKLFTAGYDPFHPRLIIQQPVTFSDDNGYFLHRNLRAVDQNILISKLERGHMAGDHEMMLSIDKLLGYYKDYPSIIKNTEQLIDQCSIAYDFKSVKNKRTFTGSHCDDKALLEKLAYDGLEYRYGKSDKIALNRIENELSIIDKLGFSAYFLITWDIIRYSMSRGFYHVGRGSGANSIVAYCLKITDVDPIALDLYFERFINPKRSSPPDFDIDYSWREREEVQDYIFKRYGHEYTALLGAMSTFRGKSIVRELGKVYGLPKSEIDTLIDDPEKEQGKDPVTRRIYDIARQLLDFPNIRSIHAGGILISEEPITYYTALDLPPKGFPTTQWDMYVAEEIGFEKLDILSQRGIGHIKDSVDIIRENKGRKIDIHNVKKFMADEKVRGQLKRGETIGCFYIESPAMRGLLKKLQCDSYIILVAASSIIRPGVAKSGMMREYIFRFHNPGKFKYLHPVMEEQLRETYGVMVYQEDVLKVCHHFAGLDLADADVLRRAMSGKFRGKKELDRIIRKFFDNCRERGYPEEVTKEVWRQIDSFAGYSFSKAHSASYAVESFQSLYLKAHYPLEFMTAVINNFGGFYRTWVYFNEAARCGAKIHLPCVNNSEYLTSIKGETIYAGFVHIANLERGVAEGFLDERSKNGNYENLHDFILRTAIGIEQLVILIRVGAFAFTGKSKPELLWDAHSGMKKTKKTGGEYMLLDHPRRSFRLPPLERSPVEDAYDEIELLGFPVSMSMFNLLETLFRGQVMAREMIRFVGKKVRMMGNLVTIKYVKTVKKDWMHFGTFLDVEGEFFDTVHFADSLKNYPFKGDGVYLILGTITQEFGFPSLTVEKMAKMPLKPDPRNG